MRPDRRTFLRNSLGAACTSLVGVRLLGGGPQSGKQDSLRARMSWLNEPASWKTIGEKLLVHSKPKTDFWRKTFYGYVTDNGHFFHLSANGDFTFQARVNGKYQALYDQAGLMVRSMKRIG